MASIRKLHAVRAIVRPDRRSEYLACWESYSRAAGEAGARVWLFEDEVLPGRFLEFTEYQAAKGRVAALERAVQMANLARACVRREGEDIIYYEVTEKGRGL